MNSQKLLALDLDGTTMNDAGELSPETIQSLDLAREKNTLIGFVTGRARFELRSLEGYFPFTDFLITNNGAVTMDPRRDRIMHQKLIDPAEARMIMELCLANHYLLYVNAGMYWGVNFSNARVERFSNNIQYRPQLYTRAEETPLQEIDGFCILGAEGCQAVDDLILRHGFDMYTLNSQPEHYNILRNGVSKWAAVSIVVDELGIPAENIIAAGNYTNDIDMILHAGIGVAVQNATEDVKAAADYITTRTNNHNAIGEIISRFILESGD